jgi:acetyl-CoA C-acetyltransferase
MIAEQWGFDRQEMERFALESHHRAVAAHRDGWFDAEIVALDGLDRDECPRPGTSLAAMAALPALTAGGRLTAAVSSQYGDASAALLVAPDTAVRDHALTPRARIHQLTVLGADPVIMLTAPIPATHLALRRCGLAIDDIDLFEVNEAFAPVVMAWLKDTGADPARVNPAGGAIALGIRSARLAPG